jgi:hypothetical protein
MASVNWGGVALSGGISTAAAYGWCSWNKMNHSWELSLVVGAHSALLCLVRQAIAKTVCGTCKVQNVQYTPKFLFWENAIALVTPSLTISGGQKLGVRILPDHWHLVTLIYMADRVTVAAFAFLAL